MICNCREWIPHCLVSSATSLAVIRTDTKPFSLGMREGNSVITGDVIVNTLAFQIPFC